MGVKAGRKLSFPGRQAMGGARYPRLAVRGFPRAGTRCAISGSGVEAIFLCIMCGTARRYSGAGSTAGILSVCTIWQCGACFSWTGGPSCRPSLTQGKRRTLAAAGRAGVGEIGRRPKVGSGCGCADRTTDRPGALWARCRKICPRGGLWPSPAMIMKTAGNVLAWQASPREEMLFGGKIYPPLIQYN